MKTTIKIFFTTLLCSVIILSCSDDSSEPEKAQNALCDGDGGSSYWPLVQGNKWVFRYEKNGDLQSDTPTLTVTKDSVFLETTYKQMGDNHFWGKGHYYRDDPSGDIVYFDVSSYRELVDIPANPKLGDRWSHDFGTREITGVGVDISTRDCDYTDVLEIYHFSSTSTDRVFYYKKGLGPVKIIAYQGIGTRHVYELIDVNLN